MCLLLTGADLQIANGGNITFHKCQVNRTGNDLVSQITACMLQFGEIGPSACTRPVMQSVSRGVIGCTE